MNMEIVSKKEVITITFIDPLEEKKKRIKETLATLRNLGVPELEVQKAVRAIHQSTIGD